MGHDKLRKFAENETFGCLLQPSASELLADGFFNLKDHPVKGHWGDFLHHEGPCVLELGCGKGEYTIELADRDKSRNYIGVDIKGARLWKGAGFAARNNVENVGFLRTRIEFITAFFAPGEVEEIWLTFSDPQMKSENSRLTSPTFLERYRKFLKPGGVVHLKTDSRFLHEYTKAVCQVNGLELLACTADLYGRYPAADAAGGIVRAVREGITFGEQPSDGLDPVVREVKTFYEKMSLSQGLDITYMAFKIDSDKPLRCPADPSEFDSKLWRSLEAPRHFFGQGV